MAATAILDDRLTTTSRPFVLVLCVLPAFTVFKFGELQFLELLLLAHFVFCAAQFVLNGFRATLSGWWIKLGPYYAAFLALCLVLAILSLRLSFYPPEEGGGPLKSPLIISVARLEQMFLTMFYALFLANVFRRDLALCVSGIKTFFWTGVLSAVYSIASYPVFLTTGAWLGVHEGGRFRGFFVEGGPYGTYIIAPILCGVVLLRLQRWHRGRIYAGLALLAAALIFSQSKAAFLLLFLLLLINIFKAGSLGQRVLTTVVMVSAIVLASISFNFSGRLLILREAYSHAEELVRADPENMNSAYGRIAGSIIVPRMIAAHPITGIGLGNYGLMRNDPRYLGIMLPVEHFDSPGLGLLGYAAELGLPLTFFFLWITFYPSNVARKRQASVAVFLFALYQPLSNLFGTQIYFFYPWLMGAFSLGLLSVPLSPSLSRTRAIFQSRRRSRDEFSEMGRFAGVSPSPKASFGSVG